MKNITKCPILLISLFLCSSLPSFGQRNCGTPALNDAVLQAYPMLQGRFGGSGDTVNQRRRLDNLTGTINIPISFHVIFHGRDDSLSLNRLQTQVDQLNRDFAGEAEETAGIPNCFIHLKVNTGFHFYIAAINYRKTDRPYFLFKYRDPQADEPLSDPIKFTDQGGWNSDASTKYLNVWTGNITDGSQYQLLGYGTFPGGINKYDGVVIYYKALGPNSLFMPYDKGRTLTHEIGHWLNLRHIWGDQECGSDSVGDTPPQQSPNNTNTIPAFPHLSACDHNAPNGDLFMDYMDYTIDAGMCMFTAGQRDRMRSLFLERGARSSILQNSAANNLALADRSVRNDKLTPVINNLKTLSVSGTDQKIDKMITWSTAKKASQYLVEYRKVGSNQWQPIKSKTPAVKLKFLQADSLYEVRLQSIGANGKASVKSTPYIFKN